MRINQDQIETSSKQKGLIESYKTIGIKLKLVLSRLNLDFVKPQGEMENS